MMRGSVFEAWIALRDLECSQNTVTLCIAMLAGPALSTEDVAQQFENAIHVAGLRHVADNLLGSTLQAMAL